MSEATIFITIPAYEDPQLISTIDGALANALYPERLFFCIGMQYKELPDISKYLNNPNFRFLFYDVETRPGVYKIRRDMSLEHSGQDYFLMIDSHMVFDKYWDATLLNNFSSLTQKFGDRVVMSRPSTERVGITFENGHINDKPGWKVVEKNNPKNIDSFLVPSVKSEPWQGEDFIQSYYACCHFFFTNKKFLSEVGLFDGIRSYCEELLISVSLYMLGWNIYFNPAWIFIGHDSNKTTKHIYGSENYTIADGKQFGAIPDSADTKLEIAKFVLSGKSKLINFVPERTADDYYKDSGLQHVQELLKREILESK